MAVAADDHVLPPFIFDAGDDPLVDVFIKVFGNFCGGIHSHKHAFHLDDKPIFDLLPSYLGTSSLNSHLRLLRLELDRGASGILRDVKFHKVPKVRLLARQISRGRVRVLGQFSGRGHHA